MLIMNDFIEVYESAYSKEYCDMAIKYFNDMQNSGFCISRQQAENVTKLVKDDSAVAVSNVNHISITAAQELSMGFNDLFWSRYYVEYANKYDVLKTIDPHSSYSLKLQKTSVGGGYHIWHPEAGDRATAGRILAFVLYLNDVEDGGETEFLYQHKRIKPKAGTLIISPAAFTHTHRGNPPLSNDKYIVTGWVEF